MKKILVLTLILSTTISIVQASNIFNQKVNSNIETTEEFIRTGNPDKDLENYARMNNISKKEAKKILKAMYGEPKRPDEKLFNKITRTGDPELDLYNFAQENNLSLEEAKEILFDMFGEPEID